MNRALVFKNRGLLLALPALALFVFGRPGGASIVAGVALALAGELIRCWAVGFSGTTTRHDVVIAPKLVTAGPYAYVRNPLYIGNFVTALGFAIAFTGANGEPLRAVLIAGSLAAMIAVYAVIVPHEEAFLRSQFGGEFDAYCARVPRIVPRLSPAPGARGQWHAGVVWTAETRTFATFAVMLLALAWKAYRP